MRAAAGQAATWCARALHVLATIVLAICVLLAAGAGVLAWRLSQGPLDLQWLAHRLEAAVNSRDEPTRLSIGGAALAWEGFSEGVDRPLDLRLTNITVVDRQGTLHARIPRAEVSLSLSALLTGRLVPRAIEVDGARLRAMRTVDGKVRLDLGSLGESTDSGSAQQAAPRTGESWSSLLAELSLPARNDPNSRSSRWSELRRVNIHNGALVVDDQQLGLRWRAPQIDIDLRRAAEGGLAGSTDIALRLGDQQARLTMQARLQGDGCSILAQLSEIQPTGIAATSPALSWLSALNAPVTLSARAELDADLAIKTLQTEARIGKGVVKIGAGELPFEAAVIAAEGNTSAMTITLRRLALLGHDGGTPTIVQALARAQRDAAGVGADITVDVDQVAFADLAHLWPAGLGGKGTRPWITQNITNGTASDAHMELGLRMAADFSDVHAVSLSGGLDGNDLTVHWLRPVPPIDHGEARLNFLGPDALDIIVKSGVEAGGTQGGVAIRGGKVTLSGLAAKDQFADIDADLAGPVADVLAVLKNPRIKLLDRRPVEMRNPSGQLTGHLAIAHLPLEDKLSVDDIQIHATTHMTDLHLGGIAAGRDLDHGVLDLDASNDGLNLQGRATLAGLPSQLRVDMDFRSGPPSQTMQKISVSATADARQLAANGLDTMGLMTGQAAVQASMATRRDGHGEVSVKADLGNAGLILAPLAWSKPVGRPALAEAHIVLDNDRLTDIDILNVHGQGIDIRGQMAFVDGKPAVALVQRLALGDTTDVHGELRWPRKAGDGWVVKLAGPSLDLSAQSHAAQHKPAKTHDDGTLPAGSVDAALDRVHMGAGRTLSNVILRGQSDGRSIREARLSGQAGPTSPFDITITPEPGGRRLTGSVADTGALLRTLDLTSDIEGGRLSLSGSYNDTKGANGATLNGQARMGAFRLRHAPVVAKLLQAMTLYGVLDAIQGPGLGIDEVVAPFTLTGDILELSEARAASPSLGATVKGSVNVGESACDLQGTIVPAYFFNTLPGKIPLIGQLFSPERGGGLFAATYSLHGPCGDPSITVNPLATLTPGFLRGLFDIFNGKN
jgi:Protein of unknown function/AsmA-like C-terminal region